MNPVAFRNLAPSRRHCALAYLAMMLLALVAVGCGGKKQTARNVPPPPTIQGSSPHSRSRSRADSRSQDSRAQDSRALEEPSGALESVPGIHVDPHAKVLWTEVGYASWYGPNYHNKKAASGEIYNQNEMTSAHNTLPLNSIV